MKPTFAFTDKMSLGYPQSNEWYLKTSGGKIQEHYSRNCNYDMKWYCSESRTPSDHDIGQGVAAEYDIWLNTELKNGEIHQSVYTSRKKGKSNVLLRYGHRYITGSPSVSVFPSGLSVTPGWGTETLDYVTTVEWE